MSHIAYTRVEAGQQVGVSADTIARAIRAGQLPAKRIGQRIVVLDEYLRRWVEGLPDA